MRDTKGFHTSRQSADLILKSISYVLMWISQCPGLLPVSSWSQPFANFDFKMYRVRRCRDQIWVVFIITEIIRCVYVQISDSSVESTKTRGHLRAACWAHHRSQFIAWVVSSLRFTMELFGWTNNKLRWWLSTTRTLCPLTNPQLKNNGGENPTSNYQILDDLVEIVLFPHY